MKKYVVEIDDGSTPLIVEADDFTLRNGGVIFLDTCGKSVAYFRRPSIIQLKSEPCRTEAAE